MATGIDSRSARSVRGASTNASTDSTKESKEVEEFLRAGLRLGVSAALHPFEYSKVLIQLGYEPIAPRPGRSIFGNPVMVLPNIFQYTGYIRRVDGFWGCYRGLAPKMCGSIFGILGSSTIANYLGCPPIEDKYDADDEELYILYKISLKRDIVLTVSSIVIAQPFHVISLRMMAQFIGREKVYRNLFQSIAEIYKHEGLPGFFSGLLPKLLCDVACVVLTSSTMYILNKYLIKDALGRQYNTGFTQFGFSSLLYPLQVVGTCMAVTGSRIMAGHPPITPEYRNWLDCWNDLQSRGELKRGSSLLRRTISASAKASRTTNYPAMPVITKYL